jgi:pyruvate dehydrogenase E2 component (dihydrolipoamide acetyltransferase)
VSEAIEFRFPDVGEGLEEGEIVTWRVAAGDTVNRDQTLVEVQTDKALVELPSPVAGRVVRLAAEAGEIVKVGQLLVVLEPGVALSSAAIPRAAAGEAAAPGEVAAPVAEAAPGEATAPAEGAAPVVGRPKAAPAVRKLAVERGVDLAAVKGTGPGGRILATDVEALAAGNGATAPTGDGDSTWAEANMAGLNYVAGAVVAGRRPLRGIRRVTAETMSRSWSEIPHITAMDELDATGLLDARRRLAETARGMGGPQNARGMGGPQNDGSEITLAVLFVAAVARALRRHPLMNASLDMEAGEIVVHEGCHIGLAVATDAGLLVPVVRDADGRTLPDLAAEIGRLTSAARQGKVDLADLRGGTFTVTNYGSLGGRFATPLIRPPEAGIMGFGAIRPRPFVVDGAVVARPTLPYCCSADHRLVDGDLLTAFSEHVAGLLADPVRLLAKLLLG